jgi:hypothetical protein
MGWAVRSSLRAICLPPVHVYRPGIAVPWLIGVMCVGLWRIVHVFDLISQHINLTVLPFLIN